jgi:hypothetical protein
MVRIFRVFFLIRFCSNNIGLFAFHEMSATIPLTPVSTASQSSLTSQELQERPWKFTGYRRFSQFLASDTDFLVIRRFDILNARVLLWLQDQLCVLEENSERLDKQYSRREAEDVNNGTMRDELPDRADMVESIYKKLKEYSRFWPPLSSRISFYSDLQE